jgi:hypothetical protein
VNLGQEDESQPERDEVHAFDEADHRKQPWDHSALGLWLPRDAAQEGVSGDSVADAGADGGATKRNAESEKSRGQSNSVVSH